MTVTVDVQVASEATDLPSPDELEHWAMAALRDERQESEISLRIVDAAEGQELNKTWRGKDYANQCPLFSFRFTG